MRGADAARYELPEAPALTARDEADLAARIADGDREARDQLASAHLHLVAAVAWGHRGRGLAVEDLIGEGTIGLMRAVDGFRASFGARFSVYARFWATVKIRDALRRVPLVSLPAPTLALLARARATERALITELGRAPSRGEIDEALELSRTRARVLTRAQNALRPEDVPLTAVADEEPEEDDPDYVPNELLYEAIGELEPLERAVLVHRFGLLDGRRKSIPQTAQSCGYAPSTITESQRRALDKLRAWLAPAEEDDEE